MKFSWRRHQGEKVGLLFRQFHAAPRSRVLFERGKLQPEYAPENGTVLGLAG